MTSTQIFGLQFGLSLIVFGLVAIWYVAPRLRPLPLRDSLPPLLLLNAMRGIGLVTLAPQVVDSHLPYRFAGPEAYGDLIAASLALICAIALRANAPRALALALVWVFNIEGTLDLLNAMWQGIAVGVTTYHLGAAWFILTVYVPALLVAHTLIFILLITRGRARPDTPESSHAVSRRAAPGETVASGR